MTKNKSSLIKHDLQLVEIINTTNQKTLVIWALDCVERFMPIFENKHPNELRLRTALNMLKKWLNGEVKMWDAQEFTYPTLVVARELQSIDKASCQIARACIHTIATCHVPAHAEGVAIYTVSAVYYLNKDKDNVDELMEQERKWQLEHLIELKKNNIMHII